MTQFEREIDLPVTPEEAWREVVDADRLAGWLGREAELDPRPGGRGWFRLDDGGQRAARVHEIEQGRRLVFTWWPVDDAGGWRPGEATTVTITLDPAPDGCRLRVAETAPRGRARALVA